jgi:hypothetical protein
VKEQNIPAIHMLTRQDIQNILSAALTEKGIELDAKRFQELLDLFLEEEFEIDQTTQPITDQIQKYAREFLDSSDARAFWNNVNTK